MKSGPICVLLGCAAMASAQVRVDVETFATSRKGQPIEAYTIYAPGERDPDDRPALLIVAGLEPEHRIGIEVARALAERDWSDAAELLETRTIYIIPNVNPDGLIWLDGDPGVEMGRTLAPFDADRDGRLGEDPPDDLNGDGIITMMRVYDPPTRYGLDLNLVAEDDEERLSRSAQPAKGEVGAFTLVTEGLDNDGDGLFNEDGPGGPGSGVNLNTNFPTHFPEFREGAGARPLSEPESLGLVDWMLTRRNIVGVTILGRGDSLLNKPTTGKYDQTGRIPKGLEKGDQAYHEHMAELYKETVSMDKAPKPNLEGSFLSWAYADFGAWAFESAVWSRPKAEKKDEAEENDEAESDTPEETSVDDSGDELAKLIAQGVPEEIARFITGTPEERQAMAAEFESSSDEERQATMAAVGALAPEIQARMMAAIQQVAGGEAGGELEGSKPAKKAKPAKPNDSDDGRWLAYSDEARDGSGFVEWMPFDHPQLGPVEIGGFVPGFKINPPEGLAGDLAEEQASFALALLEAMPSVVVGEPTVERVGSNLWRVAVEVCNPGYLPTSSTVGLKIRQPIAVDIAVEPERVAVGRRVVVLDRLLGSGACRRVEWVITGDAGEEVEIEVRSARFGMQRVKTTLEGDRP